jgi:Ca-activated chloride channel family protein
MRRKGRNSMGLANFPSPEIAIKCGIVVIPEPCPEPVCVTMHGCESTLEFDAGYISLNSLGRILKADVTLMNVCPNRRVALAAILSELDCEGHEYQRGIKILTIPAHDSGRCADVTVRCIRFVLPEELSPHGGNGMCHERSFRLRFIANYIDLRFECCTLD